MTDLTCAADWQDSLQRLALLGCGAPDLAGLGSLRNLDWLDIKHMPRVDLNRLPELPVLATIQIVDHARGVLDLSFPHRFPALERVSVSGVEAVDVRPLVERWVTVQVPRDVEVIGADDFGWPGVLLRR